MSLGATLRSPSRALCFDRGMTSFDTPGIDLHTHSVVSDGTEAPGEVVRQAAKAGLDVVALTDHDTTAGWADAADAAQETGVTLIPGIEFSSQLNHASVHVLGYLIDPADEVMLAEMQQVRESRRSRAERMVGMIAADHDLDWDDVLAVTEPGATVGRPHIADALVSKGIVSSRVEAFETVLHWRGGYYVAHYAPSPFDVVKLIRRAGGVPVLAHPGSRGKRAMAPDVLEELVQSGLGGFEVGHRENDAASRQILLEMAARHDLIVTGSSDYHGAGKPNRLGEHTTAPEHLERILEQGTGSAPVFRGSAPL